MSTSHSSTNLVAAPLAARWTLPRGRILMRALRKEPGQEYLLYIPTSGVTGAPVIVSVHGVSRNAIEQANSFARLCEARGAILVVPVFTKELHADYQRLGRHGRGIRADLVLNRCLEEVAAMTGADVTQNRLLGFSGGAQFAHRYAMAHPHRVRRALVIAAGWYTFPDPSQRFPYGIRASRSLRGVHFNPELFLHTPVDVIVGDMDIGTSNVRRTARVDAQQGTTRLERARRWVAAMAAAAEAFGIEPAVTLTEVAGVDHSFAAFRRRGRLIERVGELLLDDRSPTEDTQAPSATTRS